MKLRELDAWIAEHILGWNEVKWQLICSSRDIEPDAATWTEDYWGHPHEAGPFRGCECFSHSIQITRVPFFSRDMNDAWTLVLAMLRKYPKNRSEKCGFKIVPYSVDTRWYCEFVDPRSSYAFGDHAPEAICLAALKAVDKKALKP